ncbi:Zinc finger protein 93, partial [Buceros rhinoceros silvestris]
CSNCGQSFHSSSQLTQHRCTHASKRPHVCADCGQSFRYSSILSQHRRTHTGEKP